MYQTVNINYQKERKTKALQELNALEKEAYDLCGKIMIQEDRYGSYPVKKWYDNIWIDMAKEIEKNLGENVCKVTEYYEKGGGNWLVIEQFKDNFGYGINPGNTFYNNEAHHEKIKETRRYILDNYKKMI